jgi:hypothetical protein
MWIEALSPATAAVEVRSEILDFENMGEHGHFFGNLHKRHQRRFATLLLAQNNFWRGSIKITFFTDCLFC